MKLIIDMNLSPRWVGFLAGAAFDARHWSDLGAPTAPDTQIMAHPANNCVVLTNDLDFGAILAVTQGAGPSVVQIRADDLSPEAIGASVITALRQMSVDIAAGALVTIEPARTRISMLPLWTARA